MLWSLVLVLLGGTKDKKVGEKTRVYVGARSETIDETTVAREPDFEVESITHLGRTCSAS
ncbi:MAG TPA: hypothetical protein VF147_06620 [Vicinamibacterales bacterium]